MAHQNSQVILQLDIEISDETLSSDEDSFQIDDNQNTIVSPEQIIENISDLVYESVDSVQIYDQGNTDFQG